MLRYSVKWVGGVIYIDRRASHDNPSKAEAPRPSEARERLLRTAAELFYREGIHGIGVDRVLAEAGVTRTTMYRHFPGKQSLVVAYLDLEDANLRGLFAAAAGAGGTPRELLERVIEGIAEDATVHHTRGCPFINASAEFPDPASEVRSVVRRHRDWFRATLESLTEAADVPDATYAANSLVLLRDAMLVGGYLDDDPGVVDTFRRSAHLVVGLG